MRKFWKHVCVVTPLAFVTATSTAQDWPNEAARNGLDRDAQAATHEFLRNLCGNSVDGEDTSSFPYNPSAPRHADLTREIPSNLYDAFGHCYYACEGSRRFGTFVTEAAGAGREVGREIEDALGFDEHDSFEQDLANQAYGRDIHEEEGSCQELCQRDIFDQGAGGYGLDLSAPERSCYSCETRRTGGQCSNRGETRTGRTHGDPHIVTYDGVKYGFQTVGEFHLTRSTDRRFEIQTRQTPVNSSASLNSAVAMNVGGEKIAIYLHGTPDGDLKTPLRINHVAVPLKKNLITFNNGAAVHVAEQSVVIVWPEGERATVRIYTRGKLKYLDVSIQVEAGTSKRYLGLLGDADRNPDNDLRFPNDEILPQKNSYGTLARRIGSPKAANIIAVADKAYLKRLSTQYADGWRVSHQESLFDYAPGQSTVSFTDKGFPDDYRTLADLSTAQIQAAQKICYSEGVQNSDIEQCVFDVAFSNYSGFARSAAQAAQLLTLLDALGIANSIKPYMPKQLEKKIEGTVKEKVDKKKKELFDKIFR